MQNAFDETENLGREMRSYAARALYASLSS